MEACVVDPVSLLNNITKLREVVLVFIVLSLCVLRRVRVQ